MNKNIKLKYQQIIGFSLSVLRSFNFLEENKLNTKNPQMSPYHVHFLFSFFKCKYTYLCKQVCIN